MLGLLGAGAVGLVAGFDPIERRWVSRTEAAAFCPGFFDVPRLDGELVLEGEALAAASIDKGNIVRQPPCAVLRPGSVADVRRMVRYCRGYGIKVATRGQAHTMYGQSLSSGLVIDTASLSTIHAIGPEGAEVDAGVRWKQLILAAYPFGLTPPVITGYTNLSVGGTLSVGGISGRYNNGAQVDHVRELEVVTGAGDIVRCSMTEHRDLFEAMLGGLGQCGVITRVTMDLMPVKARARLFSPRYVDTATFFGDLRTLIGRGELDECYNLWFPGPGSTGHIYDIQAVAYYDRTSPPDNARLMRGLSSPSVLIPYRDMSYLDWILNVDVLVDTMRATVNWDRLIKPWFDVWLPGSEAESYVGGIVPTLTARDVGPTGFLLLFALRRSRLTRPFFRMPAPDGDDWVFLFDVLTASTLPGPNPRFVDDMQARNRRWFEQARAVGGTRYPIGVVPFAQADWIEHYGELWDRFAECKARFDPDNILSPGAGIFP